MRAIGFLCVFLAHTSGNTIGKLVPATFGVTLFFFLSGYLITTLLRGEAQKTGTIALKDFYIRRALRIFIPLYITFAVSEMIGKLAFGDWHLSPLGFFSEIFYFFNYALMHVPEPLIPRGFDVTWSLSVEEHFYLIFPLLFLIMLRSRLSRSAQVGVLLSLCLAGVCWRTYVSYHFPNAHMWTYVATDCRFDSILWGCLLALWTNPMYDTAPRFLDRWKGALAAISFFAIIGTMSLGKIFRFITDAQNNRYQETVRYSLQGICLYFIFYFAISNINHWSVHWLENPVMRYIGWLSYSLYLIHMSFEHALELHPQINHWLNGPIVFALSMIYAFGMRHLVELPMQRLRAKYRHAPTPVSAAIPVEGI